MQSVTSRLRRKATFGRSPGLETWIRWNRFSVLGRFVPIGINLAIYVVILDGVQILFLAFIPAPGYSGGLGISIPQPSFNSFAHVFLGNVFIGTQELIPLYSIFVFARSLYLLIPTMALLGATWHVSRTEVILKLFTFAYSWIEVSAYSYSVAKSLGFFVQIVKERTLSVKVVMRAWGIVTFALAIAAVLEVMAMNVL
jgi:hypothetical protein